MLSERWESDKELDIVKECGVANIKPVNNGSGRIISGGGVEDKDTKEEDTMLDLFGYQEGINDGFVIGGYQDGIIVEYVKEFEDVIGFCFEEGVDTEDNRDEDIKGDVVPNVGQDTSQGPEEKKF